MDGWMDGRTWAEKCKEAPGVFHHKGFQQAELGFGVTQMLVCQEGLWLGAGIAWLQSMVLGAGEGAAGTEASLGC